MKTLYSPQPQLDHVVINVADQLDEASVRFRQLGFQLTERGHHSLGSSNHLAIFAENYLELLGYEPQNASQRAELWQAPIGLTGLVWKTEDTSEEFRHLERQDLDGDEPAEFFRPVTLPNGSTSEARFRTVRLRPALVPNGRSFFCQHLTPASVWQPVWQEHPNGVEAISEFVIVAQDPAYAAQVYSHLFGAGRIRACADGAFVLDAATATVRFASAEHVEQRFGTLPEDYDGSARMAALSFRTQDIKKVKASLSLSKIPFDEQDNVIVIAPGHAFNVALRFHQ